MVYFWPFFIYGLKQFQKREAIITHQLRRHGRVTHSLLAPPSTRIGKIELNTSAPWGQNQMLINLSPYLLFLGFTPVCTGESQQKSLLPDYEPAAATRLQLQCQLPLVAVRHIFWSGTTLKKALKSLRLVKKSCIDFWTILVIFSRWVRTELQKHRSWAFWALNFSIWVISSTIFDFEFSIRMILSIKMVKHFVHQKISSDHRAISSINL